MQTFRKTYLPHLDSDLDVLYMNLDLLDESYPMVKSKLSFEGFYQGGLTGYVIPVRPAYGDMPIWVSTTTVLKFIKTIAPPSWPTVDRANHCCPRRQLDQPPWPTAVGLPPTVGCWLWARKNLPPWDTMVGSNCRGGQWLPLLYKGWRRPLSAPYRRPFPTASSLYQVSFHSLITLLVN
jgi:hypothetical protein